jgi:teichuronic acid biosynthesis glycosyltransferase TuaC
MDQQHPHLLVFSSLFPHKGAPNAGVFIRDRMFRIGEQLPITVVSPQAWFPGQSLIRLFRPHFRPCAARQEVQRNVFIFCPRFFSTPGFFKKLDGLFMALGSYLTLRRLKKRVGFDILDAHFGYPDGYAATLLGKWLRVPVTITLRGTEVPHSKNTKLSPLLTRALKRADRIFAVSESLRQHAITLGVEASKISVVANGVDIVRFHPVDKLEARRLLNVPAGAKVLISVGALVKRKGFHRVIDILPTLLTSQPDLHYLIVGGPGPEGDIRAELEKQVQSLNLEGKVHFFGAIPSDELKYPLSAADIFVLATSNEGWANVFLEAMACGLPVVTTDVGGNAEVVCRPELGTIVSFGDRKALKSALVDSLKKNWDRESIRRYAEDNSWDNRLVRLKDAYTIAYRCRKNPN